MEFFYIKCPTTCPPCWGCILYIQKLFSWCKKLPNVYLASKLERTSTISTISGLIWGVFSLFSSIILMKWVDKNIVYWDLDFSHH
ncbi:unnamed protein product [Blepharisma stoltei]|uniref:Uncharacterized protein n=1 Tax=Blepharisma stoltei TaxID=1481888 RepID=A0AAU9IFD0_9CILI|nr:unnamed protein product [Blepharisma stoltei]